MMIALKEARQLEIKGSQDNPEILKYFEDLEHNSKRLKDESASLSMFVNWVCKQAGLAYTDELNARSHLDYGTEVFLPELGDKVIFWRGKHKDEKIKGSNLKKGHVAFYIREDSKFIYCYGGNQSNTVKVSAYFKNRVLGYRRMT